MAHQHLLGLKSTLNYSSGLKFNPLRWIAVAISTVLLVLLLSYQDKINQWMAQQESKTESDIQTIIEVQEQELATIIVDNTAVNDEQQQQREELADLLAEIPDPEEVMPLEETPQEDEVTIDLVEPKPKVEIIAESDIYQHEWVLHQQAMHYTFQLMGSWDEQEVEDFIAKYALTGDVAMFESLRSGRIWYALIYGSYNNKQAALAASSQWPAPLNTLPSWLRRFDSVQKQIKNKAPT